MFGYGAIRDIYKTWLAFVLVLCTIPAQAQTITVAALGDSLTAGYGLPTGEGFVPQLQAWLDKRGADARLLNAGVSGDTTRGGLARVDWTLTDDVDAMIVTLGGNDLLRGLDPASSRANLEGILKRADEKGVKVLLVGMKAPGNYGPDFQQAFDQMYPELASQYGALHADNFFAAFEAEENMQTARAKYMQSDGIHPSKAGVARIVETLGPKVERLIEDTRSR